MLGLGTIGQFAIGESSAAPVVAGLGWFSNEFWYQNQRYGRLKPAPYRFGNPRLYTFVQGVLNATEQSDIFAGTLTLLSDADQALVSISEIVPRYANVGSANVRSVFARVGIIEISS